MYKEAVVKYGLSGASVQNTLNVEVVYLEKGSYKNRKFFSYQAGEAWEVFGATLDRFKKEKTTALLMIRDGVTDWLIRSEKTG